MHKHRLVLVNKLHLVKKQFLKNWNTRRWRGHRSFLDDFWLPNTFCTHHRLAKLRSRRKRGESCWWSKRSWTGWRTAGSMSSSTSSSLLPVPSNVLSLYRPWRRGVLLPPKPLTVFLLLSKLSNSRGEGQRNFQKLRWDFDATKTSSQAWASLTTAETDGNNPNNPLQTSHSWAWGMNALIKCAWTLSQHVRITHLKITPRWQMPWGKNWVIITVREACTDQRFFLFPFDQWPPIM